MKLIKVVFFVVLFQSCFAKAFQQEEYVKHTVLKGETVFSLAQQFKVTPYDIYRLNPDAKEGIKENTVLLIPTKMQPPVGNFSSNLTVVTHKAEAKETLYSLAKQYNVSVTDLEEWNPEVKKNGLKEGQEIIVGKTYKSSVIKDIEVVTEVKTTTTTENHVVQPQETIYSLSKQYDLTEEDLLKLNPQLKDGLKTGDTIKIKKNNQIDVTQVNNDENLYTVKPQETIYGICKQFSISEEELIALNPELKDGLKDGMVLKLPNTENVINFATSKPMQNLLQSVDFTSKKELVVLLPFNLSKIHSDSLNSSRDYIKKSKLLNVALDFYSGLKVAVDSAKAVGLPVTVKVLNIESGKTSSNVSQIIKDYDFSNTSAVIGPFMNSHVETAALLLKEKGIPVISPLSKETSKPIENLYNVVPSDDDVVAALFSYMRSKNGNIVAVINSKKEATEKMLKEKFTDVKYPEKTEKGYITISAIKDQLVKGKKNFVILESEKASQIVSVTSSLAAIQAAYDIQLVVLEVNDSFNFEEIKMDNLTKLHLLYPSITREPETMQEKVVVRKLRDANQVAPNYYMVKGFDVTFDTLLRICQPEGFVKSTEEFSSEGAENGFNYININGVNLNNKVYMQYYDTDYTIKTAK